MAKVISQFFSDLGYPLRNVRWSWGARQGNAILLRTWDDEYTFKERKLRVLDKMDLEGQRDSFGLDERIVQLKALWNGGLAGYTVIATAKDRHANPREIAAYRDDVVFPLTRLESTSNGDIIAIVSNPVPVPMLAQHAQTHRTARGEREFPLDDTQRSGLSTDSYKNKLPAIRDWLIEISRTRRTVMYGDVMSRFGLTFYPLRNAMSRLGHDCHDSGEPIITALIVNKDTLRCSPGIFDEFHIDDDVMERERCYAYWAPSQSALKPAPAAASTHDAAPHPPVVPASATADDFEQRAARFATVQVRPEQGPFRDAVFRACGGRCVVSGCAVPEALEAAHLLDRDWRKGQNNASDGILLRRDLHTLYDRRLLRITDGGQVTLAEEVREYYGEFDGAVVVHSNTVGTASPRN
jgi:hypothetical protein